MLRPISYIVIALAMIAGCFKEPVSASKTVDPRSYVYLSDRNLTNLDGELELFTPDRKVIYVNLDRNRLSSFPDILSTLSNLKWLRLNSNNLSELPALDNLTELRRIYLRDNNFSSVPEALKDLPKLNDIDLSGNPIGEIPDWLAEKKGLENLSFTKTQITSLPEDLGAWKSLISLQLGELRLSAEEMARIRAALPKTAIVF